jgi:hypothetical protein
MERRQGPYGRAVGYPAVPAPSREDSDLVEDPRSASPRRPVRGRTDTWLLDAALVARPATTAPSSSSSSSSSVRMRAVPGRTVAQVVPVSDSCAELMGSTSTSS